MKEYNPILQPVCKALYVILKVCFIITLVIGSLALISYFLNPDGDLLIYKLGKTRLIIPEFKADLRLARHLGFSALLFGALMLIIKEIGRLAATGTLKISSGFVCKLGIVLLILGSWVHPVFTAIAIACFIAAAAMKKGFTAPTTTK